MRPRKDFTKEFQLVASGTDLHETLSNFCCASRIAQCIAMFLVRLVDYVFFFGLGRAYFNRFAIYASDASNAKAWREDQQGEWDRLATGLGLLATMDAAILALSNSTAFSSACWLGGAGMSVCGIFIVQYIPVIAITMSDQEIVDLIDFDRFNPMLPVLAIAVTGPNAIACWSSALFVAGVIDYTYQNTWNRSVELPDLCYQLLTTLPVVAGLFLVFFTLFVGDWVSRHSRPPNARLMRKLEKEQEQQAPALQEKRAKEIEMQLKSAEESPETPRSEVSTSILQPPIETTEAVLAIRAAIALVKIGSTDLLEQRLREPTRSLLERVLATDVLSNIVMETATAMATDQNVKLCFPALRQQAVEVLEKAMSSALATTSPPSAATSLF
ncbi:hypothetical protein FRB98_005403 [Tulasnella sp. 332]|nr:hypothetical protein FRB98_005403 [Tulasnella sp. 332]